MIARRSAALLATVALVTALAACAPAAAPKPSPTPTGFASKEEAFAAAEKTYRAYIDALNEVDLSDPATFEPVYAYLRGDALASEKKTLTQMHADGWTVSGKTTLPQIYAGNALGELIVCQDVSAVDVTDASGSSQVAPTRPNVFALDVKVEFDPTSLTAAKVSKSQAVEDSRC
ncbi:hypothetical protein [Microbacterium sp. 11MF]|uniref:hypothetical protein n=1 Tax=Microbacterium sp. 11MF TaxID=1169146 RepID=UPI0003A80267|nr:hypothetical protein [Microbacterium sp. 11MF]